jgi:hypothetical protein
MVINSIKTRITGHVARKRKPKFHTKFTPGNLNQRGPLEAALQMKAEGRKWKKYGIVNCSHWTQGRDQKTGFYKHDNEYSRFIKAWEFIDQLSEYQLLKEYSATASWLLKTEKKGSTAYTLQVSAFIILVCQFLTHDWVLCLS